MRMVLQVSTLYGLLISDTCVPFNSVDYEELIPISIQLDSQNSLQEINILSKNDEITLEYDDRIILTFTPQTTGNNTDLENVGEYIRSSAMVNVIDTDRKTYT